MKRNLIDSWLFIVAICVLYGCSDAKIADYKLSKLKLPDGFQAEHLYSPSENGNGSWVSMTFDNKGRIIASDQYGGLYRVVLPKQGNKKTGVSVEKLPFSFSKTEGNNLDTARLIMGYGQGLVWAFNSLYVMVNHSGDSLYDKRSGLYRIEDKDGDDVFDAITLLGSMDGYEEHGPHSIILAPDKMSLYVIAGNFTGHPDSITHFRIPPVWKRDNLIPDHSHKDGRVKQTGGWIAKVDSTGKQWEIISAGLRNPFDITFNAAGELFTYDSDMEWDLGMPWYRPTRICHVTSGAEFGWRDGNAKFSSDYPDNLPPVINIGQGSPTNIVSAHNTAFPARYRNSLLAFDWSFGIIYAIHLKENGASYTAEAEEFISGAPLPLTDGIIGPDGALYFITGGRRLESDLYRISYAQKSGEELAKDMHKIPDVNDEIQIRRRLEVLHSSSMPGAIDTAWKYLGHEDRFIRYAARMILEHQPVDRWLKYVSKEDDPLVVSEAAITMARHGGKQLQPVLLNSLLKVDYLAMPESVRITWLRALELSLVRMGQPGKELNTRIVNYLEPHYPSSSTKINRLSGKILGFLQAPSVVSKTITLLEANQDTQQDEETVAQMSDLIFRNPQYGMDLAEILSNTPPADQIFFAMILSDVATGWTPEWREKYFKWFYDAYGYKGGRHYIGYIDKARKSALQFVPAKKQAYYDSISYNQASLNKVTDWVKIMSDGGPGRNWKLNEALEAVQSDIQPPDFDQGQLVFAASACIACHTMRGQGGSAGPDLTQLGTRFSVKDILESIIDPNKAISDQYAASVFYMNDGSTIVGRIITEGSQHYTISQNPFAPDITRDVAKKDVSKTKLSEVSSMPPALINSLNAERLKDLIAYLVAGGNKEHEIYRNGK